MKIDLIVLTYKPDKNLVQMLEMMNSQDSPINRIIIYNVEQKFYDRLSYNEKGLAQIKNITIRHISKRECDKGKTRNMAIEMSDADYFMVVDQNAVPCDTSMVSKLVAQVSSDRLMAAAFARQIPSDNSPEYIKYVKKYYFPEESHVRSIADLNSHGWMSYFLSNTCALYRRDIFDELGGFDNHVIFNEDILYAHKALNEGFKIAYVSDAVVINNATYSTDEYSKMFFDYGVLCTKRSDVFDSTEIMELGKKIVKLTQNHLKKNGFRSEALAFSRFSSKMLRSYKKGKRYRLLSRKRILDLTSNKGYWATDELLRDRSGVNGRLGYGRSEAETDMLKTPPVNRHKWNNEE